MSRRSQTTQAQHEQAAELGRLVRKKRTERKVPAQTLAKETGLSRSYINYLESGVFDEVGLSKFVRIVKSLKISADQLLEEAGYLPAKHRGIPEPADYLREMYKLSPESIDQATEFLEFLVSRERRKARMNKK